MTKYKHTEQTLIFPEVLLILRNTREKPLLLTVQLCSRTFVAYETRPCCPPLLSPADGMLALHTRMPRVYFNHSSIWEGPLNPEDILYVCLWHTYQTDTR